MKPQTTTKSQQGPKTQPTPGILSYIVGKTLIHFELIEGPIESAKVTPLFSMPKNQEPLARLIKAAPAMLEALKEIYAMGSGPSQVWPSHFRTEKLKAVLKRIEGGN